MRSIARMNFVRLRSINPRDTRQYLKLDKNHVTITELIMRNKINLQNVSGNQQEEKVWTLHQICTMMMLLPRVLELRMPR